MTYLFYLGLSLGLITAQTTIVYWLPVFSHFYDLLIPFVLYLGLYRSMRESMPIVFFLGFIMDNLSGTPFGLYTTAYFWIFVIVNGGIKFLHVGNQILLLIVIVSGVLIENSIIVGTIILLGRNPYFPAQDFRSIVFQVLWALFTGPLILLLIRYTHRQYEKWTDKLVAVFGDTGE
jgi:cell shape-determining protein MreD